jgi:UDP-N-acetylmuramate--alanine ligase
MHLYFLGIGGAGVGPLAILAKEAGYEVSGSDQYESEYTKYLKSLDIAVSILDPDTDHISEIHKQKPIDWIVAVYE